MTPPDNPGTARTTKLSGWDASLLRSLKEMKKIAYLLLCVAITPLFAKSIEHLLLIDGTTQQVLNIFGKLTGSAVKHESSLPSLKHTINLASEMEQSKAAAILSEMLYVNGVLLTKKRKSTYVATAKKFELYEDPEKKKLEERIGLELFAELESRGSVSAIDLKGESAIVVINLIQNLTGKTVIRSILIGDEKISMRQENISIRNLLVELDALLVSKSIYMIKGKHDTLVFLKMKGAIQSELSTPFAPTSLIP